MFYNAGTKPLFQTSFFLLTQFAVTSEVEDPVTQLLAGARRPLKPVAKETLDGEPQKTQKMLGQLSDGQQTGPQKQTQLASHSA